MKPAPRVLDNARVLFYSSIDSYHQPTGFCWHAVADVEQSPFAALAIAQYDSESGFYIFYCNSDWQVIADTWHDSVECAKAQAELEYTGVSRTWHTFAGVWVYCQACKRCYLTGEERLIEGNLWCAYSDCEDGDIHDALNWARLRERFSHLPEKPERNRRYVLSKTE